MSMALSISKFDKKPLTENTALTAAFYILHRQVSVLLSIIYV